jgi:hypothetical protein
LVIPLFFLLGKEKKKKAARRDEAARREEAGRSFEGGQKKSEMVGR